MTGHDPSGETYRWTPPAAPTFRRGSKPVDFGVPGRFSGRQPQDCIPARLSAFPACSALGRTDLALALFGMYPAYQGSIRIDGQDVRLSSVQDAIARGIAYVPEDRLGEGLFLNADNQPQPARQLLRRSRAARLHRLHASARALVGDDRRTCRSPRRPATGR